MASPLLVAPPPSSPAAASYPRIYRMKTWLRWVNYILGALFGLGAVAFVVFRPGDVWYIGPIVAAPFACISAIFFLNVVRFAVILEANAIATRGVTSNGRLELDAIAGRRRTTDGHGNVKLRLYPKEGRGKKLVLELNGFVADGAFHEWIAQLPDLDAEDLRRSQEELAAELGGGAVAEAQIAAAKKLARVVNGAGVAVVVWAWLWPRPYSLVIGILAVLPWIALAIAAASHGVILLEPRRNSARPNLAGLFLAPAATLALRAMLDVSLVDATQLLKPLAMATLPLFALFFALNPSWRKELKIALLMFPVVAALVAGSLAHADTLLDRAQPEVRRVHVTGKHMTTGKHTSYYVELDWLPGGGHQTDVTSEQYEQARTGKPALVAVFPGALHIPWYAVDFDVDDE
jgi:hypothetical protein